MSQAPKCPYCGATAKLVGGEVIYPHREDLYHLRFWECAPCDARVGVHRGTVTPLGRLANAELRTAKQMAHAAFDPLWKNWRDAYPEISRGPRALRAKQKARSRAYEWMADAMGLKQEDAHIGMFDVEQCQRLIKRVRESGITPARIRDAYGRRGVEQ